MSETELPKTSDPAPEPATPAIEKGDAAKPSPSGKEPATEVGGREGLDPTRYGDWEKNGRCIDF